MLDDAIRLRFESALRARDLRTLATALHSEGVGQVEIYDLFASFWTILRDGGRESDEEVIEDAMDFIWGWCRREAPWFDRGLTQEELLAFRRAK